MDMIIEACGATHRGNIRALNEDNIYVDGSFRSDLTMDNVLLKGKDNQDAHTYAVFDGLGGEEYGERASYIAASVLRTAEKAQSEADIGVFVAAVHRAILSDAAHKEARNMGTTVAGLHLNGSEGTVFNVGDSRVYMFRSGRLLQLSHDHSVEQSMIDCGFLDAARRNSTGHAGELTQYLGMTSEEDIEPEAECAKVSTEPGDIFILCSDGLTGELSDEEITGILERDHEGDPDYIMGDLMKNAVSKEGRDNISVIVVKVK